MQTLTFLIRTLAEVPKTGLSGLWVKIVGTAESPSSITAAYSYLLASLQHFSS